MAFRVPPSQHRRPRQRGGELIEGAVAFLLYFVMIFAIVDASRMIWIYHQIAASSREATRYAIVHGSSSANQVTPAQLQAIVKSNIYGIDWSQLSTTVTFNPNQNPGSTVKIVVVYNFSPITPFVPRSAVKMASTSQMLIYQ
jgi:Flp pilus assembly protein TadG